MSTKALSRQLKTVLDRAHRAPFRTKSNFAREHTDTVAMAASSHLITTEVAPRQYGSTWVITPKGLELLNDFYRHR